MASAALLLWSNFPRLSPRGYTADINQSEAGGGVQSESCFTKSATSGDMWG